MHSMFDEYPEARQRYEEARPIYHEIGDRLGEANACIGLANLAEAEGDLDEAITYLQPALDFARHKKHPQAEELEARIKAWQRQLAKNRRKSRLA